MTTATLVGTIAAGVVILALIVAVVWTTDFKS